MAEAEATRSIISNRHPRYSFWEDQWRFFASSYIGGKDYIGGHLFKYFKEGDQEFTDRRVRSYRENHTKRVVDLINTYLFKVDATRKSDNNLAIKFLADFDGRGHSASQFMKNASLWASVLGRIYIVVDKKSIPDSEKTGTQADNLKGTPYCYLIYPQNVLDIAFGDYGNVKWALIMETVRYDDTPQTAAQETVHQYRLWEIGKWSLYDNAGKLINEGTTGLDVVPIIILDSEEQDDYGGQSLISDIAYIDRAIFNNWSRLDTIVCDQTFSQLIFPIEGLPADIIDDDKLRQQFLTLATNRVVLYSALAQQPPSYISPDAGQAQFILNMIQTQTKQLYSSLGLQGETGTQVSPQSGVAKAYDFDKVNKLLGSKAGNLQQAEVSIFNIFNKWMGVGSIKVEITYPTDFDVKSLIDEIDIAERLAGLTISQTFTKEINKMVVLKSLPKADAKTIKTIMDEIEAEAVPEKVALNSGIFPFDKVAIPAKEEL